METRKRLRAVTSVSSPNSIRQYLLSGIVFLALLLMVNGCLSSKNPASVAISTQNPTNDTAGVEPNKKNAPIDSTSAWPKIITGVVTDADSNTPLLNVKVRLSMDTSVQAKTAADGSYSIAIDSLTYFNRSYLEFSRPGWVVAVYQIQNFNDFLNIRLHTTYTDTAGMLPDDIIPTPSGCAAYRANCIISVSPTYTVDTLNKRPYTIWADNVVRSGDSIIAFLNGQPVSTEYYIKSATKTFVDAGDTTIVYYRDLIETKAGLVRNNIISASATRSMSDAQIVFRKLTAQETGLPNGISITYVAFSGMPLGISEQVAKIAIASDVIPGDYSFSFTVTIDGKTCGSVPCTIRVTR